MPKIHSIIMPFFRIDYAPLGIACLSSYLKKHNFDLSCTDFKLFKNDVRTSIYHGYEHVFVVDVPDLPLILTLIKNYKKNKPLLSGLDEVIEDYILLRPLSFFKLKWDISGIYNLIGEHLERLTGYDIILFTTYDTNFFFTVMCSLLLRQKKPDITVIYGGPQVSQSENSRKIVLKTGLADVVVIGEGEKVVLDIIEAYRAGKPLDVKGTMTYDKGKDIFITQPPDALDINTLSCPDFSIFNLNGYITENYSLPLYSSRGCIFSCNFCNEWKMWGRFRQIEAARVVEWMRQLNKDYGTFRFYFADSLLNASLPWLDEFCELLIKSRLNLEWGGGFRANFSKELVRKLKKSGIFRVFIGAEGYSQRLLEKMNKKNTVRNNLESIEAISSLEIPLEISSIVGFPYESESDFKKCWEICKNLSEKYPKTIVLNTEPFQLRPSSKMYDCFEDFGLSLKGWDAKTINMVPEVKDIVSQIPMTVRGKPAPQEAIKRKEIMFNSFVRDEHTLRGFLLNQQKQFFKKFLKHIKFSSQLKLGIEGSIRNIDRPISKRKDYFMLTGPNGRCVINAEEKMMAERLICKIHFSETVKDLSKRLKISRQKCVKKILSFLDSLLESDIMFHTHK